MSRTHSIPSYRRHKQSGQAIVTLTDGLGGRRDVLLGKYGTAASRNEYLRVTTEWEANGRRSPQAAASREDLTINELAIAYWRHAEQHYRHPDGTPTSELDCLRAALRPLKELYGHTLAKDFGPLALKAVRQRMIESKEKRSGRPWSRGTVNLHVCRIRAVFRWGVEQELVPASILEGLRAVRGLFAGRSRAREPEPVKPVSLAVVQATLPHVLPPVRAMIELQLLAGMRPGEVVIMRGMDLDVSGKIWLYRPGSDQTHGAHKTAWHGYCRVIAIGPRGQEIIKQFLKPDVQAYLFSPREAITHWNAQKRKNRKSKVQPSQQNRRKKKPQRNARRQYTVNAYRRAIVRACDLAFPAPEHLRPNKGETKRAFRARLTDAEKAELREWCQAHRWHPHQLRHTKATEIRREAGLDAARAVLGHRSPAVTEVYAELDMGKAAEVMERLG
jgi:integrase